MKDNTIRILIADDNEDFLLPTIDFLRREGYECYYAPDSKTVIETLKAVKFDLLISDINMPGNNNLELIKELKEIAEELPIILITGGQITGRQIQSLKPPITACLNKPFHYEELLIHIRSSLKGS